MATLEEKQETLDKIKGPRFYNVSISGYGAEHAYATITKEAHDFWKPIIDEHGDSDLVHYMLNAEDGEFDFENIESVPEEADFLKDQYDGKTFHRPWYEMPNEFDHLHAVSYDSANITVDEVEGAEYRSKHISNVIDYEDVGSLSERIGEETDWETEIMESVEDRYPDKGSYIVQMLSSEKGNFFDGLVETTGNFDPKKLKIQYNEAPNGEDVICGITYDGKEIGNDGGDTNGKGYYASVYQQEF